jgi:hypothetical protein
VSEDATQQPQAVNEDLGRVNRDEVDAELIEALTSWGPEFPVASERI